MFNAGADNARKQDAGGCREKPNFTSLVGID